jgi:hypothetical protein
MPLVYMNSWASLALRAAALLANALVLLGASAGSPQALLGVTALLLAASAAHPLSVAVRMGAGAPIAVLAVAEGVIALALAALLGMAAGTDAAAAAHAAALGAPLALGLAVIALAGGVAQHDRLRRTHGGRWPALPVAIATGSAGVALLAALQMQAAAAGASAYSGAAVACALVLAAWVTHSAARLRRARRTAVRARQRDWALVHSDRPRSPLPARPATRRLHPAALWS